MTDSNIERDSLGRIVRRSGATPGAGRPREADAEKVRAMTRALLDEETIAAWQAAMRKKLRRANCFASSFVRDTLAGKPAVTQNVTLNGGLQSFMDEWHAVSQASEEAKNDDG